ncbi:VOC family protein [Lactococcus kimchii]|uniref:VOC family protein n=1 Tax=Lactococcus sp. S-13 TaxID=2507158 RepID=UPI001023F268|nr:VOC family protein [Lactococcus sp. S-13]RZI48136.1 hypothetical protein EQJ87_00980 [Lactococcus sp. S-13]
MTKLKFEGVLLTVKNFQRARAFYENLLDQIPIDNTDCNEQIITYESGISLASESAYLSWLQVDKHPHFKTTRRANTSQLYFEVDDLDAFHTLLTSKIVVDWIHKPIDSGYGTRTMRFYDYDGHTIEVAQSLPVLVQRSFAQGMKIEDIAEHFDLPIETIQTFLLEVEVSKKAN